MDALDQRIASEQKELDRLREQARAKEIVLEALKEAASLRPVHVADILKPKAPPKQGGKPKGAISNTWRNTLKAIWLFGGPESYESIQKFHKGVNDVELGMASVRDRVRSLVEGGFMSGDAASGFTVTEYAAQRFGFTTERDAPEGAPELGFDAGLTRRTQEAAI